MMRIGLPEAIIFSRKVLNTSWQSAIIREKTLLGLMSRNQLSNRRNEFVGNLHHRLGRIFKSGLVFCHCFVLRLFLVVSEYLPYAFFIPAGREPVLSHHCPYRARSGNTLSCRSSRCHLTGSVMAEKVLRAANFSRRAAMAGPRVCASETGACSTTVTSTRSGASAWDSGASPSHSSRSPQRKALYVRMVIYLLW